MTDIRAIVQLRYAFAEKFLPNIEGLDPFTKSIEELTEMYDHELVEAKRRWPSLNITAEWAEMDQWLSDHGYAEQG